MILFKLDTVLLYFPALPFILGSPGILEEISMLSTKRLFCKSPSLALVSLSLWFEHVFTSEMDLVTISLTDNFLAIRRQGLLPGRLQTREELMKTHIACIRGVNLTLMYSLSGKHQHTCHIWAVSKADNFLPVSWGWKEAFKTRESGNTCLETDFTASEKKNLLDFLHTHTFLFLIVLSLG